MCFSKKENTEIKQVETSELRRPTEQATTFALNPNSTGGSLDSLLINKPGSSTGTGIGAIPKKSGTPALAKTNSNPSSSSSTATKAKTDNELLIEKNTKKYKREVY